MGQRLNIEITNHEKLLANAYYHWGAYTSSAIHLLGVILDAVEHTQETTPLSIAVDILQSTGAGVNKQEAQAILTDTTGRFSGIRFNPAISRDNGLLSVTQEGMFETEDWEEGRITVDIGTREFFFQVLLLMNEEEYLSNYCLDESDYDNLGGLPGEVFDFDEWHSFDEYRKLKSIIEENPDGVLIDNETIAAWVQ